MKHNAMWNALTDEDRQRAMQSMPDMLDGFMKTWGWLHFAKAIEAICREKNEANEQTQIVSWDDPENCWDKSGTEK